MSDQLHASAFFEMFQTRRNLLGKVGKAGLVLGVPSALSACIEVENNPSEVIDGIRYIELIDGRNCWNGQCFWYDQKKNLVRVHLKESVEIPETIDVSSGRIRESEFAEILEIARAVPDQERGSGVHQDSSGCNCGDE